MYFGFCFELGFFPSTFKTAKVVPIFKSGNKHLVQNYRPISLLSCLSKVLEKLIKSRLLKFLTKHKILYDLQFGFRGKNSVLHALLHVTSFSYDAIQNKQTTALLLMDFTKAFDTTVSHEILMHKLYYYGIHGPAYGLIASYLSRRNHFVVVNNTQSFLKPINIGVPQGSILGSLLFLIYVNDICNATNCNSRLFADDACFVLSDISPKALELNCNAELQNLFSWCAANKLQIKPNKSFAIIIPPKINAPSIDLNLRYENKTITCCKSSKYLGVTFDN